MKRLKWFLSLVALLLLLGLVGAAVAYWLAHRVPAYYTQPALTQQEQVNLSNSALRKYLSAQEAVKGHHAQELRIAYANAHGHPSTSAAAADPITVDFSQDELNALLTQWNQEYSNKLDAWVSRPLIALSDGQIILAARLKDPAIVVSIHLRPSIDDDGNLHLGIVSVQSGSLPLPESLFDSDKRKLIGLLSRDLPQLQTRASAESDGAFNGSAVKAAMIELLLDALNHRAAPPYLFFPDPADRSVKTLPVKLTAVSVEGKRLILQLEFVSEPQRQEMMKQVRQPLSSSVPAVNPPER